MLNVNHGSKRGQQLMFLHAHGSNLAYENAGCYVASTFLGFSPEAKPRANTPSQYRRRQKHRKLGAVAPEPESGCRAPAALFHFRGLCTGRQIMNQKTRNK